MAILAPYTLKNGPGQFESGQAPKSIDSTRVRGLIDSLAGINSGAAPRTSSYTPVDVSDAGTVVEMNSAAALVFTVPSASSVTYDVGSVIEIYRMGTGTVTIAAGAGVTLRSPTGTYTLRAQYSSCAIRQRNVNEWVLAGDLS